MKKLFALLAFSALSLGAFSQTISWAYLQWAASTSINQGQVFEAGAAVFAEGLTNAAVASTNGEGITCELGYSSTNNDPSSAGWTWSSIAFNGDWGNNFYYQGTVSGISAGTYFYTFRFKLGTNPYAYAGTNGLWNGTSSVNGSFTVNAAPVNISWANLQWEGSTTINQGQSFEAGGVVFAEGVTNVPTASTTGEGIVCEIGYSITNTDPSTTGWTWSSIPFNADWGNNFYYQGSVAGMAAGTYYYTFRFKSGSGSYSYAGTNGLWNGTSSVNKSFAVNPAPAHITWANLQWESASTINQGETFYAGSKAFADKLTNAATASTTGEGIICEMGYSSTNSDPSTSGWTWSTASFNADWGNEFYYQSGLSGLSAGTYYYTFRYKLNTDAYVYAGSDGLWNGTSSVNKSFIVNPAPSHVSWANLQWAASTTITTNQSFEAGAVAFADGLTNTVTSTTGEGMTCDLGYSSANSDPSSTGWTWSPISFNADWGSNFYFQGSVSGIPAGEYYYTFRFKLGSDSYKYAGTNGLWDGSSSVNGSFVVTSETAINTLEMSKFPITLFQNPVRNNNLILNINNSLSGKYKLALYDNLGRLIKTFEISNVEESSKVSIPLARIIKGIYHLQVITPDNKKSIVKVVFE